MTKPKKSIIFLHAALGVEEDLAPLMDQFREKGYETLSFNFSGHGINSVEPKEFRIDLFASDLDVFIKKNNLITPVVFGHSMGGYVALYQKANYDDSPITQIFTYGTKFNWSEKSVSKELPYLAPNYLKEKYPAQVELLIKKHGERWKQLVLSTAHMMQHLEKIDGLSKEDLGSINIPVMLILGDQDRVVTTEETSNVNSFLKYGKIKTISHSKHELERSNLKEIAEMIIQNID
jgi:pimeloyl-ACP methyl ester carboxylesterase